jgi:hypothetical protein
MSSSISRIIKEDFSQDDHDESQGLLEDVRAQLRLKKVGRMTVLELLLGVSLLFLLLEAVLLVQARELLSRKHLTLSK